ncbi:hypothetical protein Aph01nite_23320 [Acrocarpospora phusangensis]|uniref:Glycosyltransferase RgtA/B/C/D-like domain-containing protein n=1 Tax=Acrocarpospora phusangensis TaxID=1070424 RepID=A0A919Q811_9ACTN|nr:hypothetical protein [Acrocarpospora phusangensis]GIH24022.1 hypothetical protein Aph01nite_23320 [Acrocarpospora phusangensis]
MEFLVVLIAAVAVAWLVRAALPGRVAARALPVLLVALAVRLLVHVLVIRTDLLGYGGDNLTYEAWAGEIAQYWSLSDFHFITAAEMSRLHAVAVPCNLFALVMMVCGGPAPLACTAVVGLVACALCVVLYRAARLVGADERAAFRLLVLTAYMPSFLFHTSDTFKDGINAFLVVSCLYLILSYLRRFDVRKLLLLAPLLWALWHVRPYMVFMCALPLAVGLLRSKWVMGVGAVAAVAALLMLQDLPLDVMREQLDRGQSAMVRGANAAGGSGVVFADGGDPWAALGPKVLYTVFSPFPWADGSLVFQLGKIETLIWYVLLVMAAIGARRLWRRDPRLLLILALFLLPATLAYATTMANVGLILRQRMPIVMVTTLLSALAWTKLPAEPQPAAEENDTTREHTGAVHG